MTTPNIDAIREEILAISEDWRALIAEDKVQPRRPGGITVDEYMTESGLSNETVRKRLKGMVKRGEAKPERCVVGGHKTTVYYLVKKAHPSSGSGQPGLAAG
jgi:hypothetical protein